MANISDYGYQKIRQKIIDEWIYVELQDESGEAIKRFMEERVEAGRDELGRPYYDYIPGAEITGDATSQTITFTVVAKGEEFTGKTVANVALFDEKTGGTSIAVEAISAFTFENEEDELTVNFNLQVPKVD